MDVILSTRLNYTTIMEQLSFNIGEKSEVKVIASSAYQFRVELVKKVGKDDIKGLIEVSKYLADKFG